MAVADRAPACPECGGPNVEYRKTIDYMETYCGDCEATVEAVERDWGGATLNVPGTVEWQARKRGL